MNDNKDDDVDFSLIFSSGTRHTSAAVLDIDREEEESDVDFSLIRDSRAPELMAAPVRGALPPADSAVDFSLIQNSRGSTTPKSSMQQEMGAIVPDAPVLDIPDDPDAITADFFNSSNAQKSIGIFMEGRYGKAGARKDGESEEDYSERFFTKMRWMQNNMASTGLGIGWLNSASGKEKANFGLLYTAFNDMPSFYEKGGGNAYDGFMDSMISTVADPTIIATLGMAAGVKVLGGRLAAKTALSMAIRSNKARIIGTVSVDGMLGALQAGSVQSLEKEAGLRDEHDVSTIIGVGLLSAGLSGAVNLTILKRSLANKSYKEKLTEKLMKERERLGLDPEVKVKGSAKFDPDKSAADQAAESFTVFDEIHEMQLGSAASGTTRLTAEELSNAKVIVAEILDVMPELAPRVGEKVSTAMHRVFFTIDNADDAFMAKLNATEFANPEQLADSLTKLKGLLDEQGITPAKFAAITEVDFSTAGKILNQASQLRKFTDKLQGITPEMKAGTAVAKAEDIVNSSWALRVLHTMYDGTKKADRIRRAIMTSQPVTTARNIVSGSTAVGFHVAGKLLTNTMAAIGHSARAIGGVNGAAPSWEGTVDGLKHIAGDSFSMVADIVTRHGDNRELVDLLLDGHKVLHHTLLRTTQEAGTESLPKSVLLLNSLNIAQDQILRTGVFTNSVREQMRDLGGVPNLTEFLAKGGKIPTDVAKKAVDDALSMTFANMPTNPVVKGLVKTVEMLPFAPIIGTGAFPFARFMANAISFQYRYSPMSLGHALISRNAAKNLTKAGAAGAKRTSMQAQQQFADGIVGSAALATAVYIRWDKQNESPYNEVVLADGSTLDTSAMFPIPFYLFMGDLIVKAAKNTLGDTDKNASISNLTAGDIAQGLTGMQAKASNINYMIGNFSDALADIGIGSSDVGTEKLAEAIGKYVGDIVGQYATPAKFVRDVVSAFDEEQNLMRDANILDAKGWQGRFVESVVNKAVVNLPTPIQELFTGGKLQAAESAVREKDQYRVAPIYTQLTGVKILPRRSDVEKELINKGIKPYLMLSPTGDKTADAMIRRYMPDFLDSVMAPVIESEYYQEGSLATQKNLISEAMSMVRAYAKESAEGDFEEHRAEKGFDPSVRAKWVRVPKNLRREVNEIYMQQTGTTIDDASAYDEGILIAASIRGRL